LSGFIYFRDVLYCNPSQLVKQIEREFSRLADNSLKNSNASGVSNATVEQLRH
jgi:hypothetical protein